MYHQYTIKMHHGRAVNKVKLTNNVIYRASIPTKNYIAPQLNIVDSSGTNTISMEWTKR